VDESTFAYDSQGTQLNQDKINTAMSIVWQIIIEAFQYSNLESQTIQPDISLRDFFEEKLVGSAPGEREFILSLAETWGFFIGSPWEKQSLKWFWLEECLDGGKVFDLSSIYKADHFHRSQIIFLWSAATRLFSKSSLAPLPIVLEYYFLVSSPTLNT
jgi:hypothetical protein